MYSFQEIINQSKDWAQIARICNDAVKSHGLNKATKLALEGKLDCEVKGNFRQAKAFMHRMRRINENYGGLIGFWVRTKEGLSYWTPFYSSSGNPTIEFQFGKFNHGSPILEVRTKWLSWPRRWSNSEIASKVANIRNYPF